MSKSASSEEKLSQKTNYMLKTKKKTITTFLAVTISFAICWTPYSLMGLLHTLGDDIKIPETLEGFFKMFALITPTLNPIVHRNHVFAKFFICKHSKPCPIPTVRLRQLGRIRTATGSNLGLINNFSNNDKIASLR